MSDTTREAVAAWMIEHSFPTGHGDTLNDLLCELVGHLQERAEEADLVTALPNEKIEAVRKKIEFDLKNYQTVTLSPEQATIVLSVMAGFKTP
jgi:hypothetical protein